MIVPFKFWVHGSKESWYEEMDNVLEDAGVTLEEIERIREKAQFPFYEMIFDCEIDTETGKVTYREV